MLIYKKKKSMVPPKIIQKTTAIGDMIYTAYILAHKIYIISGNYFLFGRPLKVDEHWDAFFLVIDFFLINNLINVVWLLLIQSKNLADTYIYAPEYHLNIILLFDTKLLGMNN